MVEYIRLDREERREGKGNPTLGYSLHRQQGLNIFLNFSDNAFPTKRSLDSFHFDAQHGGSTRSSFEGEDMLVDFFLNYFDMLEETYTVNGCFHCGLTLLSNFVSCNCSPATLSVTRVSGSRCRILVFGRFVAPSTMRQGRIESKIHWSQH